MDVKNIDEWRIETLTRLTVIKRRPSKYKLFFELSTRDNRTPVENQIYDELTKKLYSSYELECEFKNSLSSANKTVRAEALKNAEAQKKQRNHELIELGGLIRLVKLNEDPEFLVGALLFVKQDTGNPKFVQELKDDGRRFLLARDAEKKAANAEKIAKAEKAKRDAKARKDAREAKAKAKEQQLETKTEVKIEVKPEEK